MGQEIHYIPQVSQRRRALMGCGVYFLRFMDAWFLTPVGGWTGAHPDYLLRLAMLPLPAESLSPEARSAIARAQRKQAERTRLEQAQKR